MILPFIRWADLIFEEVLGANPVRTTPVPRNAIDFVLACDFGTQLAGVLTLHMENKEGRPTVVKHVQSAAGLEIVELDRLIWVPPGCRLRATGTTTASMRYLALRFELALPPS